jgi:hypothetical protein
VHKLAGFAFVHTSLAFHRDFAHVAGLGSNL